MPARWCLRGTGTARPLRPQRLLAPHTRHQAGSARERWRHRCRADVQATYPIPETEKEPSPIDTPQEWITPKPSKRPDIFPEFEDLETPLPHPLPGDPEQPEDEEWAEEQKKKADNDPDKEPPEPGEEPDEDEEKKEEEKDSDEEEDDFAPKPEE